MSDNIILDPHGEAIMEQYRSMYPQYARLAEIVPDQISNFINETGLRVCSMEHRIKTEESLRGKLELKGAKYHDIYDITDILGLRIITFYIDDVDKVASFIERLFEIDWDNTVDKRKIHDIDSFGYMSLHYICRLPAGSFPGQEYSELRKIRFEIQIRTVLQHAWANMDHDTGYKSGVEVPKEYMRNLNRLAGMLELADEQFSLIRTAINDYRRRVHTLVGSGKLEEVSLDAETFRSYLEMNPFSALNHRIAAVNQAEIQQVPLMPYLKVFKAMGCKTLGDIADIIRDYSEAAYQVACYQIGLTDLDIISSSLGPQDLCIAYILKKGGGKAGIRMLFDALNGESESNEILAEMLVEQSRSLPFMNK